MYDHGEKVIVKRRNSMDEANKYIGKILSYYK